MGKTGVERSYEDQLHGFPGVQQVETNAQSRILRILDVDPPVPGKDLILNIDARLQKAAFDALGDFKGAVVVIDPRNGEVLALVSKPAVGAVPPNWKPYLDKLPNDPWGRPYQYANPGVKGEIDVYSLGADGVVGGEGKNAEVGSW
ncbi:MAG: type II secretion system protein GspG, partial [Proteobacteria bacterium]|nr:type II secretion system protein GspG [Pseudomonadota bacterium]